MNWLWWLLGGMWIGAMIGYFTAALMASSSKSQENGVKRPESFEN